MTIKYQLLEVEDEVVWYSAYTELDATFLKLKREPKASPLSLHNKKLRTTPKPRLYIIGHPEGRDLEISLQDNYLIGLNERLIHYRTPTEPGSSGSPVFEENNWEVVGLHHKVADDLDRLDGGEGTYEANEAISILALQTEAMRSTLLT